MRSCGNSTGSIRRIEPEPLGGSRRRAACRRNITRFVTIRTWHGVLQRNRRGSARVHRFGWQMCTLESGVILNDRSA